MDSLDFQDVLWNKSSFIPEMIANKLSRDPMTNLEIAKSMRETPIISLRILEEINGGSPRVLHVAEPINTYDSSGIEVETTISAYAEWVTIDTGSGDNSYRISFVLQDAMGFTMHKKSPYMCTLCAEQLEECENIFDYEETPAWEISVFEPTSIPWWPEMDELRLYLDSDRTAIFEEFMFHVSHAIAESLSSTNFESMIEESELQPLYHVRNLWAEIADLLAPLSTDSGS